MTEIEKVFFEASQLAGAPREAWLDQACSTPELRQRVEALLVAHDQAAVFLETPPSAIMSEVTPQSEQDTGNAGEDATILPFLAHLIPTNRLGELGRLNHYTIEKIIGRGGMGTVLQARDEKLKRTVAIKVLPASFLPELNHRRRFLREAQAAAQISHPNIATVYSIEESPTPFMVMERVDGESLQTRIKQTGPLAVDEVIAIGTQVAAGLAAAHQRQLIHRDIKPSNILITPAGQVKIVDFGLARLLSEEENTLDSEVAGTPRFMSPEQTTAGDVDSRTDLFSLGSLMYTMCTGSPPFAGNSLLQILEAVRDCEPPKFEGEMQTVPGALQTLIRELMARDPEQRPASADEVVGRLNAIAADRDSPPGLTQAETNPPAQKGTGRYLLGIAACWVLLLVVSEASGWTRWSALVSDFLRIKTPEGTLVVTLDHPNLEVTVDGKEITIADPHGLQEFRFGLGDHVVEAWQDGKVVARKIVTLTRDGKQVFSISREPPMDASEPATESATESADLSRWAGFRPIAGEPVILDHGHFVLGVCFSPNGEQLATTEFGGIVRVWDLASQQVVFEQKVPKQKVPHNNPDRILFSPDGQRLTCGIYEWETATWTERKSRAEPLVAWSHDGALYAIRVGSDAIHVVRSEGDQVVAAIRTNQTHVHWVEFSHDQRWLATGGSEDAKLWELSSGNRASVFSVSPRLVLGLAFSPDDSALVIGGGDQAAHLWGLQEPLLETPAPKVTMTGHRDNVTGVLFHPGGDYVVSVAREAGVTYPEQVKTLGATIKFWDPQTGVEFWNQSGHRHNVTGVAMDRSGSRLATGSYDKTARVWNLLQPPAKD